MLTTTTFTNPTTGKEYSGGNIQRLIDATDSNPAFISGQFATFRQWLSVGRCVLKGQRAAARLLACGHDALAQTKDCKPGEVTLKRGFVKGFSVFALEQTGPLEGAAPADADDTASDEPAKVDRSEPKANTDPLIRHHGDRLIEKAQRLERDAKACFADRLTNTAKRLGQAMGKRLEGERAQRTAQILRAVNALIASDPGCIYARIPAGDIINHATAAARMKTKHVSNGYHSYLIETSEPEDNGEVLAGYRSLIDPRTANAQAQESKRIRAEAELRQCEFPGFFPTPSAVVSVMLEQAGDLTGKTVLEPSAGKGNLVQAAFRAGAGGVVAFEHVPKLADYIANHVAVPHGRVMIAQCVDFLGQHPPTTHARVDVVLMNPPFERDAAPKHVLHALLWLKPGGRLVSVMPANWAEKSSADPLYAAVDALGLSLTETEVDGAAFNGADSFRQTAVRTSIVVIA